MPRHDDEEQRQRPWLRTLHAARENCREAVADALVEINDADRALWPQTPRLGRKKRVALAAHVAVIDYADQIRPFRENLETDGEGLWTEELGAIRLSEAESIAISLDSLSEIESREVVIQEETHDELRGTQTEARAMRVVLPASLCRACYRQLNEAVNELGFAAKPDASGLPKGALSVPDPNTV